MRGCREGLAWPGATAICRGLRDRGRSGDEVTVALLHRAETRPMTHARRVGFCGLLGAGNLGNDGSLEVMLAYLRAEHPDVIVDCMSTRPDQVTARYGIPAVQLRWYRKDHEPVPIVRYVM